MHTIDKFSSRSIWTLAFIWSSLSLTHRPESRNPKIKKIWLWIFSANWTYSCAANSSTLNWCPFLNYAAKFLTKTSSTKCSKSTHTTVKVSAWTVSGKCGSKTNSTGEMLKITTSKNDCLPCPSTQTPKSTSWSRTISALNSTIGPTARLSTHLWVRNSNCCPNTQKWPK